MNGHRTSLRLRRWFVAGVIGGLAAGGLVPLAARAASPSEAAAVAMVNNARRAEDMAVVRMDARLASIARRQSDRMRAAGRIFHNAALNAELSVVDPSWVIAGENVGVGGSLEAVHRAFLASPAHKHNVLGGGYDSIAISVVPGRDGQVYVTQIFARFRAATRSSSASCRPVVAEDGSVVPASFYRAGC